MATVKTALKVLKMTAIVFQEILSFFQGLACN